MSKKYKVMTEYKDPRQGPVVTVEKNTFDSEEGWQEAIRLVENEVHGLDLYGPAKLFTKDSLHIIVRGLKRKDKGKD